MPGFGTLLLTLNNLVGSPTTPSGVALQTTNYLYVIGKFSSFGGPIRCSYSGTFINDYLSSQSASSFNNSGITVGNSYILYSTTNGIYSIAQDLSGSESKIVNSGSLSTAVSNPTGIYFDILNVGTALLYVADTGNHRIQIYDELGNWQNHFGSIGNGSGNFTSPKGVFTFNGNVYVADTGNNRVCVWNQSTLNPIVTFGSSGSTNGLFNAPTGISADSSYIYVADSGNSRIQRFNVNTFSFVDQASVATILMQQIAVAPDKIYVALGGDSTVRIYQNAVFTTVNITLNPITLPNMATPNAPLNPITIPEMASPNITLNPVTSGTATSYFVPVIITLNPITSGNIIWSIGPISTINPITQAGSSGVNINLNPITQAGMSGVNISISPITSGVITEENIGSVSITLNPITSAAIILPLIIQDNMNKLTLLMSVSSTNSTVIGTFNKLTCQFTTGENAISINNQFKKLQLSMLITSNNVMSILGNLNKFTINMLVLSEGSMAIQGSFKKSLIDFSILNGLYTCFILNTNLGDNGISQYTNFNFDSFGMLDDGTIIGINSTGIFVLDNSTSDNLIPIQNTVQLGLTDAETSLEKKVTDCYVGLNSNGLVNVTLTNDNNVTNAQPINSTNNNNLTQRAILPLGIKGRYLGVGIQNSNNSRFKLDCVEMLTEILDRRVG